MKECAKEEIAELGKLLALVSAEDFVEDPEQEEFECKLSEHCSISKLYSDYLSVEKECNEMKEKCAALEKECEENKNCLEEKEAECKLSKEECEKIQKECDELKFSAFMEKATSAIEEAKDSIGEEVAKNVAKRRISSRLRSLTTRSPLPSAKPLSQTSLPKLRTALLYPPSRPRSRARQPKSSPKIRSREWDISPAKRSFWIKQKTIKGDIDRYG